MLLNKNKIGEKMEVRASHILVEEEIKANELKKQIDGGYDFARVAKKHSKCPSGESGGVS